MSDLIAIKTGKVVVSVVINPFIVFLCISGINYITGIERSLLSTTLIPLFMSVLSIGFYLGVFISNHKFKEFSK